MPGSAVLYVEDEEYDVLFMDRAFKKAGVAQILKSVPDGQEAIDYLAGNAAYADRKQHPLPAMMLLDLNLPRVSGFEVLQWLRQQPQFQTLPVVIFSSSGHTEDKKRASELGANAYIEKPASALQFVQVAEELKHRWLPQTSLPAGPA